MASYQHQLESINYKYNAVSSTGYNKINGFSFMVKIMPSSSMFIVSTFCNLQDENMKPELDKYLNQFVSDRKYVKSAVYSNNSISIVFNISINVNIAQIVKETTDAIFFFFTKCPCVPVCPECGKVQNTDIYLIEQTVVSLCPECFNKEKEKLVADIQIQNETVTNYPMGILGAIIGGLVGAVLLILFFLMGRVVFIAGIIAGILGVVLFSKMGKKLTLPGLIISLAISLIMLLAGMYFSIGMQIYNECKDILNIQSFFDSFKYIPIFMQNSDTMEIILSNNIYGITGFVITAAICVFTYFKNQKQKGVAEKLY